MATILSKIFDILIYIIVIFYSGHLSAEWSTSRRFLFGVEEHESEAVYKASVFSQWLDVIEPFDDLTLHPKSPCARPSSDCYVEEWLRFLYEIKNQSPLNQLNAINDYINRTPYSSDLQRWGRADYIAPPSEFLGQSGDCEDFAIAKYISLKLLGWSARDLRLVYLDIKSNQRLAHAILVAYTSTGTYVLDNLILPLTLESLVLNYSPRFSINEEQGYFYN